MPVRRIWRKKDIFLKEKRKDPRNPFPFILTRIWVELGHELLLSVLVLGGHLLPSGLGHSHLIPLGQKLEYVISALVPPSGVRSPIQEQLEGLGIGLRGCVKEQAVVGIPPMVRGIHVVQIAQQFFEFFVIL